ncbi:sugar transferase [Opitutaceae bacterium]|nr:sugar transferase [Opitutaceae bacterium]
MLSHPRKARTRLGQIADGGLFMLALGGAYALRVNAAALDLPQLRGIDTYLWLFPWVAIIGPWMLSSQGFYTQPRLTSRWGTMIKIVRAGLFTVLATILAAFLLRADVARSVVILVGAFGGFFVYLRHELSAWSTGDERWQRRVLWVGTNEENIAAQAALSATERDVIINVDECDPATTSPEDFETRMRSESIDAVIASMRGADTQAIQSLLAVAEREGVELLVRPGVPLQSGWRLAVDDFGGEPVLYIRAQEASPIALSVKQALDYLLAAILGVVLSPFILVIALAVKITSRGPVLFLQTRGGKNGREFSMLKFRTMRVGAEAEKAELAAQNEMKGPVFKMSNDPRVTWFGRILRRHSLDELPQLWNVLRGEMSLVGPRPLPVSEVQAISEGADRRRLSVKPGLTGLWQISGRSDLADFSDWVRLDLTYIDQWSLWLDAKILLATVPVAILGRGSR